LNFKTLPFGESRKEILKPPGILFSGGFLNSDNLDNYPHWEVIFANK
jgi:hypothetical protein